MRNANRRKPAGKSVCTLDQRTKAKRGSKAKGSLGDALTMATLLKLVHNMEKQR